MSAGTSKHVSGDFAPDRHERGDRPVYKFTASIRHWRCGVCQVLRASSVRRRVRDRGPADAIERGSHPDYATRLSLNPKHRAAGADLRVQRTPRPLKQREGGIVRYALVVAFQDFLHDGGLRPHLAKQRGAGTQLHVVR